MREPQRHLCGHEPKRFRDIDDCRGPADVIVLPRLFRVDGTISL